jgi:pimeloyl-ACP methyl ester carboxylesterase
MLLKKHEGKTIIGLVACLLILQALLSACGSTEAVPTSPALTTSAAYKPLYQSVACAAKPPEGYSVTCGSLTVPENRQKPAGTKIQLHVAIIKSTAPKPSPDPVIFLAGGPGDPAIDIVFRNINIFKEFLGQRDLIVLDQRGAGYSTPALDCHEDSAAQCKASLLLQGIDLTAYNTRENAADVNDLISALGYQQVNLYGGSYGTALAQAVMRDYPSRLRSVVLDSVVPPQSNLNVLGMGYYQKALENIFEACAADPACNWKYPDLEKEFYELVERLNAQSLKLEVLDEERNRNFITGINGASFVLLFWQSLYYAEAIVELPRLIHNTYLGDYDLLKSFLKDITAQPFSQNMGMFLSMYCSSITAFEKREEMVAAGEGLHLSYREEVLTSKLILYDNCLTWNVPPLESRYRTSLSSNVPTLLLSGQYDPITPPALAAEAARNLSRSFNYVIPGHGHGVIVSSQCARSLITGFMGNPQVAPDSRCVNDNQRTLFN